MGGVFFFAHIDAERMGEMPALPERNTKRQVERELERELMHPVQPVLSYDTMDLDHARQT